MRTVFSDVYSLGLVMLQVIFGEADIKKTKQLAQQLWKGEPFHEMVDALMPGERPAEILGELICLALACTRIDNANYRPKVGSPMGAPLDDSTILSRLAAVQLHWSRPHIFAGRLEALVQEARRAGLQQREVQSLKSLASKIGMPKL